jgi:hypothetical protein
MGQKPRFGGPSPEPAARVFLTAPAGMAAAQHAGRVLESIGGNQKRQPELVHERNIFIVLPLRHGLVGQAQDGGEFPNGTKDADGIVARNHAAHLAFKVCRFTPMESLRNPVRKLALLVCAANFAYLTVLLKLACFFRFSHDKLTQLSDTNSHVSAGLSPDFRLA